MTPGNDNSTLLSLQAQWIRRGGEKIIGPVAFELDRGETVAITGPSGVGKTTLLRTLAGLEQDFYGQRHAPDKIAVMFQAPTLLPWRNLADNLRIAGNIDTEAAEAALASVGLAGLEQRFPEQLSLGQQRRAALARTLATDAPVLLMDEPFASLDAANCAAMIELIKQCPRRGQAILLIAHETEHAQKLAQRILKMDGMPARLSPAA